MKEEEMGRKKKEWDKEAEKRVIKEVEELKKELFRAWHGTFFFCTSFQPLKKICNYGHHETYSLQTPSRLQTSRYVTSFLQTPLFYEWLTPPMAQTANFFGGKTVMQNRYNNCLVIGSRVEFTHPRRAKQNLSFIPPSELNKKKQ